MLFYLTDSLIVENDDAEYKSIFNAVRNLALASENSYHILLGDEKVIEMVRMWFNTDPGLRPLFDDIANRYMFGIPSYLTYYVEVVKGEPQDVREENGVKIAQMKYSDFRETKNVQSTLLIGEDDNDCVFFKFICDWYVRLNKLKVNYSLNNISGGGENTYREIEKALNNEQFSLTIVDTDIRYPNQRIEKDSTYDKCRKVRGRKDLYKVLPLNVHEIENIVPHNYIDQLDSWTTEILAKNKQHYDCLIHDAENILPFFDLKKGILLSKINGNVDYTAFAEKCYLQNEMLSGNGIQFSDYCNGNLDKGGKGNKDKIVYRGVFSNILSKLLEKIKDESLSGEPDLFNFQRQCWNEISQTMLNWGCARNKEALS